MARPNTSSEQPVQPSLSDLLAGYLRQQVARQAAGLANADNLGEVVPFEAVHQEPVEAGLAWREAVAVAKYFQPNSKTPELQVPPDWANLVASAEPVAALAFSFGNYPQMVRDLHALRHATNLAALLPTGASAASTAELREWAALSARQEKYPCPLLAAGILRFTRQFEAAEELLNRQLTDGPTDWKAGWANEEASLAWHRGQTQRAADLWKKQTASVPVLFNRGMSNLFLGKGAEARPLLTEAVAQLPEDDGWHHLARLYLTLAEML